VLLLVSVGGHPRPECIRMQDKHHGSHFATPLQFMAGAKVAALQQQKSRLYFAIECACVCNSVALTGEERVS